MGNKNQVIFIDESGIHKEVGHSVIVLVYVIFKNIEGVEQRIIEIEKELKIKPFHWKEQRWKIKKSFLSKIVGLPFEVKVFVLKNPINIHQETENALRHLITEKKIKKIIIEGNKPKWYELKIKKVLRDKGISVNRLRSARGTSFPGLRLADALAGLIRSYFDKPMDENKKFYQLLKKKITALFLGGQVTS